MFTIADLYDLDHTLAADYLRQFTYPWEALKGIKDMILALGPTLGEDYEEVQMYIPYPVKTVQQQIAERKAQLSATDYKVIKCSECQLLGKEMPYDVEALHVQRQALRDEINKLEQEE